MNANFQRIFLKKSIVILLNVVLTREHWIVVVSNEYFKIFL